MRLEKARKDTLEKKDPKSRAQKDKKKNIKPKHL